jgi:hypothetical protein
VDIAPVPYCIFILIGAGELWRDGGVSESEGTTKGSRGMTGSFSHSSSEEDESSSLAPALALPEETRRSGGVR